MTFLTWARATSVMLHHCTSNIWTKSNHLIFCSREKFALYIALKIHFFSNYLLKVRKLGIIWNKNYIGYNIIFSIFVWQIKFNNLLLASCESTISVEKTNHYGQVAYLSCNKHHFLVFIGKNRGLAFSSLNEE